MSKGLGEHEMRRPNGLGEIVLFVMGLVYFGILIVSMLAPFFVVYAIISIL